MSKDRHDDIEGRTFEELLVMLDESVTALEGNGLSLEDSLAAYEKSARIVAACNDLLDRAELKVSEIDVKYLQNVQPRIDDDSDWDPDN